MKVWNKLLAHVAWSGLILSSFQAVASPVGGQPQVGGPPSTTERASLDTLPDSPGTTRAQTQDQSSPSNPRPEPEAQPPAPAQGQQPAASQPPSQSSQAPSSTLQRPVGTAAAETSNASGVAASQPAGVAIAPAKQRRVRTIVLRVGALVGAGVAVGTVVALTQGTPSKPPGAH
jgi:cytoskeletal protein RodZ